MDIPLYKGQTIEEIGLGGLGFVKFAKPGDTPHDMPAPSPSGTGHGTSPIVHPDVAQQVDHDEMSRRQAALEAKLRRMEEALKQSETRPVRRAPDEQSTEVAAPISRK